MKFLTTLVCVLAVCAGCTTVSGLKNPKYIERSLSNAAILVVGNDIDIGLNIEKTMATAFLDRSVKAIGITEEMQFARRDEDVKSIKERLLKSGFSEIVYVKIGDIAQSDIAFGAGGKVNNIVYTTSADTSEITMYLGAPTRYMNISCQIDDLVSGEAIWKGKVKMQAQGLVMIRDRAMVENGVASIVGELENDTVILRKRATYPDYQ
ncbi:MAG: hypothetical protein KZQ95_01910 [Candidatus Thiodiazotropha sp. (ex Epidulcina cf. delphinae)]|nr:hypothetical protein [Candidatus Thiodiazotropha sp. (ex Epidulcina cf. delphinae)]